MNTKNIFDHWGTLVDISYSEFMSQPASIWRDLLIRRNLICFRGITENLTDLEYYEFGKKFGYVWGKDDYKKPYISNGFDPTLSDHNSEIPVSYFQPNNNMFSFSEMLYHADMPHIKELSFPGRCLYMFKNTIDGSGSTTWLNLESGWEQSTIEEKSAYDSISIVMKDMYRVHEQHEEIPFLKKNPNTNKMSPSVNTYSASEKSKGWINHLKKNGIDLSYKESGDIINSVYTLIESKKDTIYRHNWVERDIIVYDNWFSLHKRDRITQIEGNQYRQLRRLTFNI